MNLFVAIDRLLAAGESLVLARIVRQLGSAPRSVGTGMAVRPDGSLVGTIGGGRLEYEVLQRAAEVRANGRTALMRFQLTGKDAAESEMLCGGVVEVFLEPLDAADPRLRDVYRKAAAAAEGGRRAVLATVVAAGSPSVARALLRPDGTLAAGELPPEAAGACAPAIVLGVRRGTLLEPHADGSGPIVYLEPVAGEPVLYLFGAGHVSISVAALAHRVGFRVWVIDDRPEFANRERFPDAERIRVTAIDQAFREIDVTPNAYIVIVTRGHVHDHQALGEALKTQPAYIGMIGSRRKRDIIFRALREAGVPDELLDRVHSPIGIDIGAETPEEIAVSIVAELIAVRAAGGSTGRGRGRPAGERE